jgi:hypothetical protein
MRGGAGRTRTSEQVIMINFPGSIQTSGTLQKGEFIRLDKMASPPTFDWTSSPGRACMQNSRDG